MTTIEIAVLPDAAKVTIRQFLNAWKRQDWEAMLKHTQLTWASKGDTADRIDALKALFEGTRLVHFKTHSTAKESPSATAFKARLTTQTSGTQTSGKRSSPIECMVICEDAPYNPSEQGKWGVNPVSLWHR